MKIKKENKKYKQKDENVPCHDMPVETESLTLGEGLIWNDS